MEFKKITVAGISYGKKIFYIIISIFKGKGKTEEISNESYSFENKFKKIPHVDFYDKEFFRIIENPDHAEYQNIM